MAMTVTKSETNISASRPAPEVQISKVAIPAFATVSAWCALSGMGRSATYEALGAGHLRAVKLGSRTLIDVPHGLAWLNSLPPAAIRPHGASRTKHAA